MRRILAGITMREMHRLVLAIALFAALAPQQVPRTGDPVKRGYTEADFPRAQKISDKVKKQNDELASKYGVRGYPTVFLLDAEGKQLGRTGYKAGGAEAYVKHLKEMLETAGVKTVEKPEAAKPLSAYEKMKAERAAKAAQDAEKK